MSNKINQEKTYEEWLDLVNRNGLELKNVPKKFKDYHLCHTAILEDGFALEFVPKELRDYHLCSEAVDDDHEAIKSVPKKIIDYQLAHDSVINDGNMLRYVPRKLKDLKMCNNAIYDTMDAFKYVPKEFRTKEFCLESFDRGKNDFLYIPEKYLKDEEFLIKAIERNTSVFKNIPKKYLNLSIIKTALKINGLCLRYVPKQMMNEELLLIALNEDRNAIDFVPNKFINDELFEDLLIYRTRLKSKKQELNLSKKEKWDTIVSIYPEFIKFIPKQFRCREIYMIIFKSGILIDRVNDIFKQIPDELLDKDLCFGFLKEFPNKYECVPERFLKELSDVFEIIKTSYRDVYVIKLENGEYRFSIGCQYNKSKDYIIDRIHHDDYGEYIEDALSKYPHRQEYLNILERY